MPLATRNAVKKFLTFTFKLLATVLLWIGTAILTKLRLASSAEDWQTALQQLPLWALVALIILFPIAWLMIEFTATCFIEVRARVLEKTAPRFAQWLTEFPTSVCAVIARWGDSCVTCIGHLRFDGRFRTRISEECHQLHNQTGLLHATAGFSLKHAYTELHMAATQYGEIDPGLLASSIRGRESIYSFLRAQLPGTALAILGRPGGGKTTLFRHLALLYASGQQGRHRLRRRIPIIIELRRVTELFSDKAHTEWKPHTLIQVIQQYWKRHSALGALMENAPKDWLKRHLASGRVLVMVDGLDEVPHRVHPDNPDGPTPRRRVSQWIETEMQREGQRECLFLVTSRPGGFAEAPLKHRVSVLEVQPLTSVQSESFIYSFHLGCYGKAHPTAKLSSIHFDAMRATEKLQNDLRKKPHLADLRVNPLLLHMLCLVHYLRGRLPVDRSDLYRETCDVLLNRDLRAPGIEERLRPQDKLAALQPLADYFMRSRSPEAKRTDELFPLIQPVFNTLNFPASEFLDYIAKDSGLLQEIEQGHWDFAHKTFYEYLASEYWEKHPPTKNELIEWVEEDWWRICLLFYSARSEDSPVISAAMANLTPKAWSLAFACLSAGHRINAEERTKADQQLRIALSHPSEEESFRAAARALFDLRMRDTVSASPDSTWLRRDTFVTKAEYQLFMYSVTGGDRTRLVPLHWVVEKFDGDPFDPVRGVGIHQAHAFANWARAETGQTWQLPDWRIQDSALFDGCWVDTPSLRGERKLPRQMDKSTRILDSNGHIKKAIMQWATSPELNPIPDGEWEQLLSPQGVSYRRTSVLSLRRSIVRIAAWVDRVFPQTLSKVHTPDIYIGAGVFVVSQIGNLLTQREGANLNALGEMYMYFLTGFHGRGIDRMLRALGNAFYTALGLEHNLVVARVLTDRLGDVVEKARVCLRREGAGMLDPEGLANVCVSLCIAVAASVNSELLVEGFSQRHLDVGRIRKGIEGLNVAEAGVSGWVFVDRKELLIAGVEVLATAGDPIVNRRYWTRFASLVCQMCLPHVVSSERDFFKEYSFVLTLLWARASRSLEPWEGILLVRQA